jgi:hypothetical protein
MGERQLYLRGLENRRRYIDTLGFLALNYDPMEIDLYSSNEPRV